MRGDELMKRHVFVVLFIILLALIITSLQQAAERSDDITGYQGQMNYQQSPPPRTYLWINPSDIKQLPQTGPTWDNVYDDAQRDTSNPDLEDQNDKINVYTLAKAYLYHATGDTHYRDEAKDTLMTVMQTPLDPHCCSILGVARNVGTYVLVADLIDLRDDPEDAAFRAFIDNLQYVVYQGPGGPALSLDTCLKRPNNFGTHCINSLTAIRLYLNDDTGLNNVLTVFKRYLGEDFSYTDFEFGSDLSWQCDPSCTDADNNCHGINPPRCTRYYDGDYRNIDGVIPDDQRRGGSFTWPPPQENYVYEALQGVVVAAGQHKRASYFSLQWGNNAIKRAFIWLHNEANFPAEGDDEWQPWVINCLYGTNFPATSNAKHGKNMGYTDWTHDPTTSPLCN